MLLIGPFLFCFHGFHGHTITPLAEDTQAHIQDDWMIVNDYVFPWRHIEISAMQSHLLFLNLHISIGTNDCPHSSSALKDYF